MKGYALIFGALVTLALPAIALADDPKDPSMRNPAARARDREGTRKLNLQELATIRQRDAANMKRPGDASAEYAARSRDQERAEEDYARDRAQYERDIAQWRRAVAACRAGDYSACGS